MSFSAFLRSASLTLATVPLFLLPCAAQRPQIDPTLDVVSVVLRDFDAWDTNHDGTLQKNEVYEARFDQRWKDVDGAAISAITGWIYKHPNLPPLTKEWFLSFDAMNFPPIPQGMAAQETQKETQRRELLGWGLRVYFRSCLQQIRRGPYPLYSVAGPRITDIQQLSGGDCLMLAPLGSVVYRNPEDVRQMIREEKDGYTVAFPDGISVHMGFLTDAQIGLDHARLDHGAWVRLFEEAFYRRPSVKLVSGMKPVPPFQSYTNHRLKNIDLIGEYQKPVNDARLEELMTPLRSMIPDFLGRKKIIICGTKGKVAMPPRIPNAHVYAVLGYDPTTDVITVWTPWGDTWRQGPGMAGITLNGSQNGVMQFPLKVFVRVFDSIGFELDETYPRVE